LASSTARRDDLADERRVASSQEGRKLGFVLDTERGYWQRNDLDPDDKDDPLSGRTERVIHT